MDNIYTTTKNGIECFLEKREKKNYYTSNITTNFNFIGFRFIDDFNLYTLNGHQNKFNNFDYEKIDLELLIKEKFIKLLYLEFLKFCETEYNENKLKRLYKNVCYIDFINNHSYSSDNEINFNKLTLYIHNLILEKDYIKILINTKYNYNKCNYGDSECFEFIFNVKNNSFDKIPDIHNFISENLTNLYYIHLANLNLIDNIILEYRKIKNFICDKKSIKIILKNNNILDIKSTYSFIDYGDILRDYLYFNRNTDIKINGTCFNIRDIKGLKHGTKILDINSEYLILPDKES
jgi:hypothetical protein